MFLSWIKVNTGPEQKKPVLRTGFWPHIAHCLIHVIPLGSTAAILFLTINQTYWRDPSEPYTQTTLQGMQFAAKVYEAFICVSLASVVLDVLRRDLLGDNGVPFGHVISSFTFTELTTIFSPRFWAGFDLRRKYRSSALLLGLLTVSILLAAAAGPSAAIAVIPRLGWWAQEPFEYFNNFGDRPQYTVYASISELWPPALNGSHLPASSCNEPYNVQAPTCPGRGYETLLHFALYWKHNRDTHGFARPSALEPLNFSFPETKVAKRPFSQPHTAALDCFADTKEGVQYGTVASTSSLVVSASLWNILQRGGSLIQLEWERAVVNVDSIGLRPPAKPFVQVKCVDVVQETDFNNTGTIRFPNEGLLTPGFSKEQVDSWRFVCETWNNAPNLYKDRQFDVAADRVGHDENLGQYMETGNSRLRWVDLPELGGVGVGPSLGAAVYLPKCNISAPAIYARSIDARWLPTATWIEPTADSSIHGTGGSYRDLLRSMAGDQVRPEPIHLGLDWADALNTQLHPSSSSSDNSSNITTVESILNKVLLDPAAHCLGADDDYGIPMQALEASLGFVVVDGLSRVGLGYNYSITPRGAPGLASGTIIYNSSSSPGSGGGIWDFSADELSGMPGWSNVTFSFKRYGYGYGFGTATTAVAIVVLVLHAVIALAAMVSLFFQREVSNNWGDYGQMFALALKSKPPVGGLENAGAGLSKLGTWKEKVVVRAERDGGGLELIFKDEEDYGEHVPVHENIKYS